MAEKLLGKDTSLWLDTTPKTNYPPLSGKGAVFDVVIVGGGIAGILTAWLLQKAGLKTALAEKARLIENTTGNTTAKLTSQHNLIYDFLIKEHGQAAAKAYGQANEMGIKAIEELAGQLAIDCDFEMRDAYVYTTKVQKVREIKTEVEVAKNLGLPASFETSVDLPIKIEGAIRFSHQAQFHPRKFLLGVASAYEKAGGVIYEQTEAEDIEPAKTAVLKTKKGDIKAKYIVGATKYPFWRTQLFEDLTWTKLSYALGVTLNQEYPGGMYINADRPVRTMRSHPYKNGQILIFGGESHEMTKDYDKNEHYQNLIDDVRKQFKVDKIIYRWIAGDMMPNDRMPYIGSYPGAPNILIITGFHAWGLAWGMSAAEMIRDEILGKQNPWANYFSLERIPTNK